MASIVDKDFFYGKLYIAQLDEASVIADLNNYILDGEREYLVGLLGYEMYLDFKAELDAIGGVTSQKYLDLLNGKQYEYGDVVYHWPGLSYTDAGRKKSPIANYIYFKYISSQATATTGSGEKKIAGQNSAPASPVGKLAVAWNEMVNINRQLVSYFNFYAILYNYGRVIQNRDLLYKFNPLF